MRANIREVYRVREWELAGVTENGSGRRGQHTGIWLAANCWPRLFAAFVRYAIAAAFIALAPTGHAETNCSIIPQEKLGSVFLKRPPPSQPTIFSNPNGRAERRDNVVLEIKVERLDPNSQTMVRVLRVLSDDMPQSLSLVGKLIDLAGNCHKRLDVGDTGTTIGTLLDETGEQPAFYPVTQH